MGGGVVVEPTNQSHHFFQWWDWCSHTKQHEKANKAKCFVALLEALVNFSLMYIKSVLPLVNIMFWVVIFPQAVAFPFLSFSLCYFMRHLGAFGKPYKSWALQCRVGQEEPWFYGFYDLGVLHNGETAWSIWQINRLTNVTPRRKIHCSFTVLFMFMA